MPHIGSSDRRNSTGVLIRRARLYDAFVTVLTLGRARRIREAVLARAAISTGERVLDVGCGTGTLAMAVKRRVGPEGVVHGVDASPEMVALAKEKAGGEGLDVHYQVAAAQALPFEDSTFDVVLCTLVVHHLPRDQRGKAIAEIFRVLKPGGRLLVVDLAWEEGVLAAMNPIALLHGRRSLDTTQEARALIKDRGFSEITAGGLGFRNLGYVLGWKP